MAAPVGLVSQGEEDLRRIAAIRIVLSEIAGKFSEAHEKGTVVIRPILKLSGWCDGNFSPTINP